jgi:hypothetical protein
MRQLFLCLTLLFIGGISNAAEVISVNQIEDCWVCSSAPSMTMYWKAQAAKQVLIVIPGGDGYIGFKQDMTDLDRPFPANLKRMTDSGLTRGETDLVFLDSPRSLGDRDLGARGAKDHLIRIESAIRFYKEKTGLPVWLLGQSNGGASIANFIRYLQDKKQTDLIAGVIASTPRPESNFPSSLSLPVMFIIHRQDGCRVLSQIQRMYEQVKDNNLAITSWVVVESGESQAGRDVCSSGYHMFYKAGEEYTKAIDDFIAKSHP